MAIRHWIRFGLLCRTLVRRNFHLCSGAALEQNRLLYVYNNCCGARQIIMRVYYMYEYIHKILVHAQDSCACTTTLVHAQHSCACTGPGNPGARDQCRGQGPGLGPKKAAVQGLGPAQVPFWVPGLVPGPWVPWPSACTRVLCMHKSVVHAQEFCACTRILTFSTCSTPFSTF